MNLFSRKKHDKLYPESLWTVKVIENEIVGSDDNGTVQKIPLETLTKIEIETNDSGPFMTDVYWMVTGTDLVLKIPQGATGEAELLTFFQTLPGFRNEAVIDAMGCTDNKVFTAWEKPSAGSGLIG